MTQSSCRSSHDRGSALIITLLATLLLSTLGLGLLMISDTETSISANYRAGNETLYAADAAIERVTQDILLVPRWDDMLTGAMQSAFVDNTLMPTMPSGEPLNLTAATTDLQTQSNASSPWGANNPQWRLFAYGPLADMLGSGSLPNATYIAVWIADDPAEIDGNPLADTNGVLTLFAQAFGLHGTKRAVEVTVAKTNSTEIERGQIAQRGQEELNQRARKAAVELPGKSVTVMDMNLTTGGTVIR